MQQSRISRTMEPPPLPGEANVLATRMRQAAISVTRFKAQAAPGDIIEAFMPSAEAFVVMFQREDHPAHDFRFDGRFTHIPPVRRATLNIVDLQGEPKGELRDSVDTLMFHLPRAALDEITEDAGAARIATLQAPEAWATQDRTVEQLQGLIAEALAAPASTNRLFYDHLVLGLGAHFATAYGGMRPRNLLARGPLRGGLAPWQERRATELLASRLTQEVSLWEIAQGCGLSLAHFSRAFKISTGTTPHQWLQTYRIGRAKEMLLTIAPLAEIALALGFSDQSHFTRVFSQATGSSPGSWRRLQ